MRKSKKTEKNKSLRLGLYFGLLVAFIIIVSVAFKVFDSIKKSEFDGNFFTIAVITGKDADLISFTPKESGLKMLTISGAGSEEKLKQAGIPFDSLAKSNSSGLENPKSYISDLLFHRGNSSSSLTFFDLIRLFIYAQKSDNSKTETDSVSFDNLQKESQFVQDWFSDTEILREKKNIEITNTTSISGLGNKFAETVSHSGATVVLVNSSPEPIEDSIIYFKGDDSYTVKKLSKILDIPVEKKEMNKISDIVIIIGKDRQDY